MIKVNKQEFLSFLKLVTLKNELENNEVILNIEKNNMDILTASKGNIGVVYGSLKGDFNVISRLGIGNLKSFIDLVSQFESSEFIELDKKENKLQISSESEKLKITIALKNPEYVVNTLTVEKFNEIKEKSNGNWFILPYSIVNKIRNYSYSLKTKELKLSNSSNNLDISVYSTIEKDNKEEIENEILASFPIKNSTDTKIKDFNIKIGTILFNILDTLKADVEINLETGKPIGIRYNSGNVKLHYLLAPLKN